MGGVTHAGRQVHSVFTPSNSTVNTTVNTKEKAM
jgi:hypothetical protein